MVIIKGVIPITAETLNLAATLTTGQNFRWKKIGPARWLGIIRNFYVVILEQCLKEIRYEILNSKDDETISDEKFRQIFDHYFRLDMDIEQLYECWNKRDKNFARISPHFRGIRLLRQDLIENIFSFICSANNNVSRITGMVEKLCTRYGNELYHDEQIGSVYSFPSVETLAAPGVEPELRKFGFGYRARYVYETAGRIARDDGWTEKLRTLTYPDARQTLMSLPGIGAKVADCICLMSLGFTQSIPVDTHIYRLTGKFYMPHLVRSPKSSLTTKRYNEIADFYREKFQSHSGWAQTVLFCSDLKQQTTINDDNDEKNLATKKSSMAFPN